MTGRMKGRLTLLAGLVPVLGLLALVGRAEWAVRQGPTWTIPIEGFDPRDLLHGQYLQYQYRLRWQGIDTCGEGMLEAGQHVLSPECCLCLHRDTADGFDPFVRQVECDEAPGVCEATLRSQSVLPPLRYFVPEGSAAALESALRTHEAAIELSVSPAQEPAVRQLVLDRRPWREVLDE